jgi:hypothetical protein
MIGWRPPQPQPPALMPLKPTLFRCEKTNDILLCVGEACTRMTLGEWTRLIVHPTAIRLDPPEAA